MMRSSFLLLLLASAAFAQDSYDQLLRHWDYDTEAPLAIKQAGVQEHDGIKVHDLTYQDYRQKVGPEKFDAFVARYSWTDPGKYVSHSAGTQKLLQFATDEPFLEPEQAKQYLPYVSEPKTLALYEAPHALNAEATRDRLWFLARELKVKTPDAKLVASIPPLVQPPWPKPPGTDEKKDEKKDK